MDGGAAPGDTEPTAAARDRVAALLERLSRLNLQVAVVGPPDPARFAARDRARTAAIAAGRGPLLDEAVTAAREGALRAFAGGGFSGTWAASEMAASVATASDRVAAAAAFEEAATAAVAEDLVDIDTLEILRSTSQELGGLTGVPQPGELSNLTSGAFAIRGPLQFIVVVAFVAAIAIAGFVVGGTRTLVVLVLAFAIIAALVRRLTHSGS